VFISHTKHDKFSTSALPRGERLTQNDIHSMFDFFFLLRAGFFSFDKNEATLTAVPKGGIANIQVLVWGANILKHISSIGKVNAL
jgi:hypothetical protein